MKMYKGSSKPEIEIFYPQDVVSDDVGKLQKANVKAEKVVWASNKEDFAIAFAMLMGKVKFGVYYRTNEKPILSILTINPEEFLNFDDVFFIYELEDAKYKEIRGPEYISLSPVKVKVCKKLTMRECFDLFEVYKPSRWVV